VHVFVAWRQLRHSHQGTVGWTAAIIKSHTNTLHQCTHCSATPPTVRVRLTGSDVPTMGRLEVWSNGYWATVAQSALSLAPYLWAPDKVCQELGHVKGQIFANIMAPSTGARWLHALCNNENVSSLADCTWSTNTVLASSVDVNIVCTNISSGVLSV